MVRQVLVWIRTALDLARIPPEDLVVHAIEGCPEDALGMLRSLGVRVVESAPFPGGPPTCNKLVQLSSDALREADRIVLCDCDLAWNSPLGPRLRRKTLQVKIVDFANPELEVLHNVFREAGLPPGREVETSFRGGSTLAGNCNGGIYIIPGDLFPRLEEPWTRWAHWVRDRADSLGAPVFHTDQIAFALSLQELGIEVDHLTPEFNCPSHFNIAAEVDDLSPRVIHFHGALDPSGYLKPTTVPGIDRAIERINECLRLHPSPLPDAAPGDSAADER